MKFKYIIFISIFMILNPARAEIGTYQISKSEKAGPYILDTRNGELFELRGVFNKKMVKLVKSDLPTEGIGTYQMSYSEEEGLFGTYIELSDFYMLNTSTASIYKLHTRKMKWISIVDIKKER